MITKKEQKNVIPNNYEGMTPSNVWAYWSPVQKSHFLRDHFYSKGETVPVNVYKLSYEELPVSVRKEVSTHIHSGQYKNGGEVKNKFYIDFLNKKKGFKRDRKYFESYEEARKWALKNFDKFDSDMIKTEMKNGGSVLVNKGYSAKTLMDLKPGDFVWKEMQRFNPQLGTYYTLTKAKIFKVSPKKIWLDSYGEQDDNFYDRNTGEQLKTSKTSYGSAWYRLLTHQQMLEILKTQADKYRKGEVEKVFNLKEEDVLKMAIGGSVSVYNLKKGDKVKTRKGEIETIIRKTGSGSYETIESEYSHSPESLEFVSRPGRKIATGGNIKKTNMNSKKNIDKKGLGGFLLGAVAGVAGKYYYDKNKKSKSSKKKFNEGGNILDIKVGKTYSIYDPGMDNWNEWEYKGFKKGSMGDDIIHEFKEHFPGNNSIYFVDDELEMYLKDNLIKESFSKGEKSLMKKGGSIESYSTSDLMDMMDITKEEMDKFGMGREDLIAMANQEGIKPKQNNWTYSIGGL